MTHPTEHREIELRFSAVDPGALADLPAMLAGLGLHVRSPVVEVVRDVYLDTGDWWFFRAGIGCRLRTTGEKTVLTLKALAPDNDGMSRLEFEEELATPPDPSSGRLPGERLKSWLAPLMPGRPVQVKLRLDQTRRVYDVTSSDGLCARVYADHVRVNEGPQFAEIELELDSGHARQLQALGEELGAKYGLASETLSKFEHGLQIAQVSAPALVEGDDLALRPEDRFVDAAYRVLRRHFGRFRWNEPGTRMGLDPEYLHDMRVATRRMRAALRVFRDALPARRAGALKRDLQWVARALGRVRDLDVYLLRSARESSGVTPDCRSALHAYQALLRARREHARTAMLRMLDTRRFAALVERFRRFLEAGAPKFPSARLAGQPVLFVASRLVKRHLKKLLREGRRLDAASTDEDLHAMRIRCKRMRYICEFFSDLYHGPAQKFARRVTELQDVLGDHQDAVVAQAMLKDLAASAHARRDRLRELHLAMGQMMALHAQHAREQRAAFFAQWQAFDRKRVRRVLLKQIRKTVPSG